MSDPVRAEQHEIARLKSRLDRERRARLEAEMISERVTRELYDRQRELELLQSVAAAANQSSLAEAFQTTLDKVCEHMDWPVGHLLWPVADQFQTLISSNLWHLKEPQRFAALQKISQEMAFPSGVGLPGRVMAAKKAIWVPDVTQDGNFPRARLAVELGVRAGFAFPVMVGEEVAAVLEFFSADVLDPDESLLELVTQAGVQMGRIIERHRAETRFQQQFHRVSLLNHISRTIAEWHDLDSLVNVVLKQLEDHLAIDLGSVCLVNPLAGTLTVATFRFKAPAASVQTPPKGTVISLHQSGLRDAAQGQTMCIPDTSACPAPLPRWLAQVGVRSVVAVPLIAASKVFGLLIVARAPVDAFSKDDREFLRMLGAQVAVAVHQSRLHLNLKNAYEELRQTQQVVMQQERLRALGQMASGIAHDINNALSPVVGYAELLLRSTTDPLASKHLQSIKTAGEDISHIVARLREFYRNRDKKDELVPVRLNELAAEVIDLTRPRWRDIQQARGIAIDIQTSFEPALPEVVGNGSELREALTNLVFNAIDAMPQGGALTLRTKLRMPDGGKESPDHLGEALIEVCDTGIGMDHETRQRCLEPFFTTKGERGTGLGLAMVYGVIHRHDGSIEIDSEPGLGTTMRLVLPCQIAGSVPALAPAATLEIPPLHILFIDDEPLLRELMKTMLDSYGHTVHVAEDGRSGLDSFREARRRSAPFDVVITDLGMPYMDGWQVAQALKMEAPSIPVFMMTGWGTLLKGSSEPAPYVDGIISKPPQMREISEALSAVLPKRDVSSP